MAREDAGAALKMATGWARTLAGVRDPALQIGWVRAQIARAGPVRAADVLTIVLARAEQRDKPFEVLLLRTSLALASPELTTQKRAIARIAEVRGQAQLARFLGIELDADASAAGPEPASGDPASSGSSDARGRMPTPERGRPLSLGERKSLARRRDRNLLARVLRDPHPDVIRILLDNPALTEIDVVRLCARRPVPPGVLGQVFRHARWVLRYRVRRALALNPHTPEDIALQLLPHLTRADLSAVARSGEISERVRAACAAPTQRSVH